MPQTRQLAAIMFTDIVGYTALMGKDSAKALELIRISKEIQKPLVQKHNGKWLKEMGDGAMAQFASALDALHCAIAIQKSARAELDAKLRIGIHLGDVQLEDNDVYGDGVNVASRLESIADPGGIYISESIEKAIRGQTNIQATDLGEIRLKNVDYGVRIYAIQGVGLPLPEANNKHQKSFVFHTKWVAAISTILLVATIAYIINISQRGEDYSKSIATHLQIALSDDLYLAVETNFPVLAISPDGSTIVFVAVKSGKRQLYLKRLEDPTIQLLPGTEDCVHPFFSTDGNWIGFIKNTSVFKMPVTGGIPRTVHQITPMSVNRGITWYKQDSLVHTPSPDGGLMIGSASGEVTHPLSDWLYLTGSEPHYWPNGIGEINSVLFTEFKSSKVEDQNIILFSLKDSTYTTLINGGSFGKYSGNHILFARQGSLFATSFEPNNKGIGEKERLLVESLYTNNNGSALFAVGGSNLAYVEGQEDIGTEQLVWVDRKGNFQTLFSNGKDLDMPAISPKGDRIALTSYDGPNSDLWLFELERNTFTRLTSHPGEDFGPVWSPDGKQIAFSSEIAQEIGEEGPGITLLALDSSDPPRRLLRTPGFGNWEFPLSWSSDGERLLFASTSGNPFHDLEVMDFANSIRKSWEQTSNSEIGGVFSPDGNWIAYVSDISGRYEIYVRASSATGARKQVSVHGGTEPLWSPDGKEIFYREYDKLLVVSVEDTAPLSLGPPKMLFEGSFKTTDYGGGQHNYDITLDGSRFVMINRPSSARPRVINVILNWDKM